MNLRQPGRSPDFIFSQQPFTNTGNDLFRQTVAAVTSNFPDFFAVTAICLLSVSQSTIRMADAQQPAEGVDSWGVV
jgi:hypothetical protein